MDDLSRFCCQNKDCADYGKRGHENLSVYGDGWGINRPCLVLEGMVDFSRYAIMLGHHRNPYSITIILRSYPQYNQAKAHFDDEIGTNSRGKWNRSYRENSGDRRQDSTINTDDPFTDGTFHNVSKIIDLQFFHNVSAMCFNSLFV